MPYSSVDGRRCAPDGQSKQISERSHGIPGNVPERLAPYIVPRSAGRDMLGVTGAAARLQVSRTTVYDWVDRRTLLAWKSTRRGLTIPAEQILGPGKVVDGLAGPLVDPPLLLLRGTPMIPWHRS